MKIENSKWIIDVDNNRTWDKKRFICPDCGDYQTYGETDYCPMCGKCMKGGNIERKTES